ncbi:MAG: alpha-mannosidase [Candidatus Sumerlaeia bacterium]
MSSIPPSSSSSAGFDFYIISHTHWDREWYWSFETFRQCLTAVVDHALDVLERDPRYGAFHLDGQTAAVLDYLEIRPRARVRLRRLARAGRLLVGPFYVLNDTNLTTGESTVRNLLLGHLDCEDLGVRPMKVGYVLDQFGHIGQLPQILRGFGIRAGVTARGIRPQHVGGLNTFHWQAPDGSRVLMHYLVQWYNNFQRMPEDTARAAALFERLVAATGPVSPGRAIALMNGVDHLDVQPELPDLLEAFCAGAREFPHRFHHGPITDFFAALDRDVRGRSAPLPVWRGELRDGDDQSLLTGTLSSRVYLKQENARRSRHLERVAEPWCALAALLGAGRSFYPADALRYAWRTLIQNHPHDSICGCSIDEVHRQMMARFARVRDVAAFWEQRAAEAVGYRLAFDPQAHPEAEQLVVVWNPSSVPRPGAVVDMELDLPARPEDRECPRPVLHPLDDPRQTVPLDVLSFDHVQRLVAHPAKVPFFIPVWRYRVRVRLAELPPLGYRAYALRRAPGMAPPFLQTQQAAAGGCVTMENEHLRVLVNPDGSFDLLDKASGRLWTNLHTFEDSGDAGTEYNFIPPLNNSIVNSAGGRAQVQIEREDTFTQRVRVSVRLDLPEGVEFAAERRTLQTLPHTIESLLVLQPGGRSLEITTRFENMACNHRLRAIFPVAVSGPRVLAEMPFDVVERTRRRNESEKSPVRGEPHAGFVAVMGREGGLAVLADGLPEYEFDWERRRLELTLLRAVGALAFMPPAEFRGRMRDFATPEAQCLDEFWFRYALLPCGPDQSPAALQREADAFLNPPRAAATILNLKDWFTGQSDPADLNSFWEVPLEKLFPWPRTLPSAASLLECDNPAVAFSAFKRAERSPDAWICRIYNLSGRRERAHLRFPVPLLEARRADLNERPARRPLPADGAGVVVVLRPHQILTLWLRFQTGE